MRMLLPPAAFAAVLLVSGAETAAQSSFISPVTAATTEGTSNNIFPFSSTAIRRYQQIHSDWSTGGVIKSMACRLNGSAVNYAGTAAIDLEMFMGLAATDYDQMSQLFDANYFATTKTQVVKRQIVNLGPQGQNTTPGVFTGMLIKFDTPFPYAPVRSLIWEAVIHANTITPTFSAMDADASVASVGAQAITGAGCVATGQTAAMVFNGPSIYDMGGIVTFATGVTRAPASAPVVLSIGATNPNIVLPGIFCGGIYTDLLLSFPVGVASTTGIINSYQGFGIGVPNVFGGGLTFYGQMHALDAGLSEFFKIANSEGRSFTPPAANTTKVVKVSRMQNNTNVTTDPKSSFFTTSTIGYGLVTRFDL